MNYVKLLRKDTGIEEAAEIKTAMMDREGWRDRARRTSGPPVLRPGEVMPSLLSHVHLLLLPTHFLLCLTPCRAKH